MFLASTLNKKIIIIIIVIIIIIIIIHIENRRFQKFQLHNPGGSDFVAISRIFIAEFEDKM